MHHHYIAAELKRELEVDVFVGEARTGVTGGYIVVNMLPADCQGMADCNQATPVITLLISSFGVSMFSIAAKMKLMRQKYILSEDETTRIWVGCPSQETFRNILDSVKLGGQARQGMQQIWRINVGNPIPA